MAEHINRGHVICTQFVDRRNKENFLGSGFIAVDLDYGWKLEELLASDYVNDYASIVYTTANHTPAKHRLRIIFELERVITDPVEMTRAFNGIIMQFDGDTACSTPCQMFYGSKGSDPIVIGKILPNAELDRLILLSMDKVDENSGNTAGKSMDSESDQPKSQRDTGTTRSAITLKRNELLKTQAGHYHNITDIEIKTNVHCPNHADKHASAFVLTNKEGVKGVHCRKCKQTFWPEGHARAALLDYDFYEFENHIDELEYEDDPATYLDENAPKEYWSDELRTIQRRNERYLSELLLEEGLIFLRSPKGSGKTQRLIEVVNQCRKLDKSILLIGHRQLLLGELAKKLGLHYYKDKLSAARGDDRHESFRYLAICVDSMPHLLDTMSHQYDVVIIDESEQVLMHLTSKTLRDKRRDCYLKIEFFIRKASTVIASDADLGFISVAAIGRMREGYDTAKIYANGYKSEGASVDFYESKKHLLTEMQKTVMAGGLHYICCNSKGMAKTIAQLLIDAGKPADKIMLVTSDNSQTKEIRKFLVNIEKNILAYDVLIASPSLGTGIDITFKDQAQLVDTVYGFFDPLINTHFDIDQQLARVRHPQAVKVWVTPEQYYFECEPDVIKENCIANGLMTDALTGYDNAGRAVYDKDDKIFNLYANVLMLTNASKNNLKKHLTDLKRRNGWVVNMVETDETGFAQTTKNIRKAKRAIEEEYVDLICNATVLSQEEYKKINRKHSPTTEEFCAIQRYRIEKFYDQEISPQLVLMDDKGKFRSQIHMMMRFLSPRDAMIDRDYAQAERTSFDRDNNLLKKDLLHNILNTTGLIGSKGDFLLEKEICSADLKKFVAVCIENQQTLQGLFEMPLRRDLAYKPMMQLNQILKLIGLKTVEVRTLDDANNKRTFFHAIDASMHAQTMEYVQRRMQFATSHTEIVEDEETGDIVRRFKNSKQIVQRIFVG
ncbi:MAG: hypothetical protein NVS3B3_03400 [Aquirhabdus sp.]